MTKTGFSPAGAMRRRIALLVLQLPMLLAGAGAVAGNMEAEIDYLVAEVADSDCTFIRNGREHDARAASKHLQMKRERGRRHYDTTAQFVERIASKSSWSGQDYQIRCGDTTVTAKEWFSARLAEYGDANSD